MRQWAIDQVNHHNKRKLIDLIAAIPTIQELGSLGINLYELHENELEELCRFA